MVPVCSRCKRFSACSNKHVLARLWRSPGELRGEAQTLSAALRHVRNAEAAAARTPTGRCFGR